MATQAREAPTLGVGPAAPTAATLAPAAAGANTAAAGRARLVLEAPLTRLTVGMWASRHHRACQLLILPEQEQLVVLCDRRSTAPRSPSRFSLASHVHKRVAAKSPFASGHSAYRAAGCVHAFEVPFHAIRGMDYNNPLCHEARLVLEAVHLRKREFATVEAARDYFLEATMRPQPCPCTPEPAAAGSDGSGLLQAALAAGAEAEAGGPASVEPSPVAPALGDAPLSVGSGARGSLLWRLDASVARAVPQLQLPASQPLPIGGSAATAAAAAAGVRRRSSSSRGSLDSLESDPGSPASGSLWYWGSPASRSRDCLARASGGSVAPGSPTVLGRRSDSSDSRGSWEDVAAGRRPSSRRAQQQAQRRAQQAQEQAQQALPMLHVGSAPNPSHLAAPSSRRSLQAAPTAGGQPYAAGLHRVASEGQLLSASAAAAGGPASSAAAAGSASARAALAPEEGWPAAHAFTTVSKVYPYRTVVLNWRDPCLPGMLRPIIQGNERLLRLHESGLPAWAVYAPQYGLWYRPWLRTVTWLAFYAFSVFSFAVGFYDLYKVVPGLQVVMHRLMASIWLPPTAVLEWLEQHTQIRLSILLTYLFGKSEAFVWFMRWAQHCLRLGRAAVQPVMDVVAPPLVLLGGACSAVYVTLAAFLQAGLLPVAAVLLECWAAVGAALLPVVQLLQALVAGPVGMLASGLRQVAAAGGAAWALVAQAGAGAASGVAALAGTAKAGRAVGSATSQAIAGQAIWLYILPADALEVLRTSAVKVAKAAQAVFKFCLQMCDNVVRHRLTLGLRAGRAWRRAKGCLRTVALAPLALAAEVFKWLVFVLRLLVLDRIAAAGQASAIGEPPAPKQRSADGVGTEEQGQQQPGATGSNAEPLQQVHEAGNAGLRHRTAAPALPGEVDAAVQLAAAGGPSAAPVPGSDRPKAD